MGAALRHLVTLETRARTPDGAGGFLEAWQALGSHWVGLKPATGRATEGDHVTLTKAQWTITLRGAPVGAPSRPIAGQRFRMGSRIFAILAVQETSASGRWLTCRCKEEAVA